MNILVQCSNRSYLTYIALCKELHKVYPDAVFGYCSTDDLKVDFENSETPFFEIYDLFNYKYFISSFVY